MSKYRYQKGAGFERELVAKLWSHGWAAARIAGSGSTKYPVPDIVAIKDNCLIIIECKSTSKKKISLSQAVRSVGEFAKVAGCSAYVAVKFPRVETRFFNLVDLLSRKNKTVGVNDNFLKLEYVLGEQCMLDSY